MGLAFLTLGGLAAWRGRDHAALAFLTLGALLGAAGLAVPGRLGPVFRAWMALAHGMSKVTTPIFMGLVYFGVFTPVGLAMRLFGRRPLDRRLPDGATSRWMAVAADAQRSNDMRRQF